MVIGSGTEGSQKIKTVMRMSHTPICMCFYYNAPMKFDSLFEAFCAISGRSEGSTWSSRVFWQMVGIEHVRWTRGKTLIRMMSTQLANTCTISKTCQNSSPLDCWWWSWCLQSPMIHSLPSPASRQHQVQMQVCVGSTTAKSSVAGVHGRKLGWSMAKTADRQL